MISVARNEHPAGSAPDMSPLKAEQVSGVLLCGGRSRRMGRDKALLEYRGRPLLLHGAGVLAELCGEVRLACGPEPRYREFDLPLILDPEPEGGPLLAILTALEEAPRPWILALACDLPHIDAAVLTRLFQAASEEVDAVVFRHGEHVEPLAALYSTRCAPAIRVALAAGQRRMVAFWERPLADGSLPRILQLPHTGDLEVFRNWNHPDDMEPELEGEV